MFAYAMSFRAYLFGRQSTVFSGKGLKFSPIRSEKALFSRFYSIEYGISGEGSQILTNQK